MLTILLYYLLYIVTQIGTFFDFLQSLNDMCRFCDDINLFKAIFKQKCSGLVRFFQIVLQKKYTFSPITV